MITKIEPADANHEDLSEALLDGRIAIVRAADLEGGGSAKLHTVFLQSLATQEESREK